MKKTYIFSLLFAVFLVFGQSKLRVLKNNVKTPIANASISCNGKLLGKTNAEGELQFKTKCKKVDVKATGYDEDEVVVDKVMEMILSKTDPNVKAIDNIIIQDRSDPKALAILQKVNDHYKENSPQSLPSYSFKSYEKISLDLDEDSIKNYSTFLNKRIDSIGKLPIKLQSKEKKKDSIESINMMKLMTESKLFLWERAQEFLYSSKYGEKINVLDNRVSGLKQPIYELLTVRSNRLQMPKEIREENRGLYRFFLTDSIEIDGRNNYVIRFRQVDYKKPINKRKFNGYLYIDTETYALKKIESNSKVKSEGSITSIWKPIENKWFLVKENFKIKGGDIIFDDKKSEKKDKKKETQEEKEEEKKNRQKYGNYFFMTADYFDVKTPIEENSKDFRGYTYSVKNTDGSLLDKYRTDTLTTRETKTYEKIDSVGKKYKLDQKIGIFTSLIKGKLRAGIVDLDLSQILKYNQYEGLRIGIAAKLNEKFNPYISPDAYVGYGFKDTSWKYGAGIDVKTTLEKNSFFRAEYFNDVMSAGRFNENLWNFKMKIMNSGVDLKNDRFFHFEGFKLAYETDLGNSVTMNLSAKRQKEEAKFNYNFMNLGNDFTNVSTMVTLKYSPNSKNIMTPSGKYTFEQNYPELYLNYEQGIQSFGGDFNFSRIDAIFNDTFKTKLGVTGARIYGGITIGKTPIWHQFQMNGLGAGKDSFNFNLTSYLGFSTMEGGKYYNDRFAGFYLTHRIPWYFKSFGKNISSFDLVYRGIIGDMKNTEYHQFDFEKLDHYYQEIGLEWNNFLSTKFNLGFFYRVGYYSTPDFKQNFAIQFKFNQLGF